MLQENTHTLGQSKSHLLSQERCKEKRTKETAQAQVALFFARAARSNAGWCHLQWYSCFFSLSSHQNLDADWYDLPFLKRMSSRREEWAEVADSKQTFTEGRISQQLLTGYNRRGRPLINVSFQLLCSHAGWVGGLVA